MIQATFREDILSILNKNMEHFSWLSYRWDSGDCIDSAIKLRTHFGGLGLGLGLGLVDVENPKLMMKYKRSKR